MSIEISGFARPIPRSELRPGDVFVARLGGRSRALCLALEEEAAALVLNAFDTSDDTEYPFVVDRAALRGAFAVVDQALAIEPGEWALAFVQERSEDRSAGDLVLVPGSSPAVCIHGGAIGLATGAFVSLGSSYVVHKNWRLVWRPEPGRCVQLASFPDE